MPDARPDTAVAFRGLTFALLIVLPFWAVVALAGILMV
jgi:uncharacterized iron-regulated membrane protein